MKPVKINARQEELLRKVAHFLAEKRMTPPAVFFLETMKPLNSISSQILTYLEPFLTIIIPRQEYNDVVALLEQREGLEYFLTILEDEESKKLDDDAKARQLIKNMKKVEKSAKIEKRNFLKRFKK